MIFTALEDSVLPIGGSAWLIWLMRLMSWRLDNALARLAALAGMALSAELFAGINLGNEVMLSESPKPDGDVYHLFLHPVRCVLPSYVARGCLRSSRQFPYFVSVLAPADTPAAGRPGG